MSSTSGAKKEIGRLTSRDDYLSASLQWPTGLSGCYFGLGLQAGRLTTVGYPSSEPCEVE